MQASTTALVGSHREFSDTDNTGRRRYFWMIIIIFIFELVYLEIFALSLAGAFDYEDFAPRALALCFLIAMLGLGLIRFFDRLRKRILQIRREARKFS